MKLYKTIVLAACLAATTVTAYSVKEEAAAPLVQMAYELMARTFDSFEVLTINLTNLVILLTLKMFFFGASIFGLTTIQQQQRSGDNIFRERWDDYSSSNTFFVKPTELSLTLCFMLFTSGNWDKFSCIQRAACEDPKTANNYLTAAKMWHKMHNAFPLVPFYEAGYIPMMDAVESATYHSLKGGDCSMMFRW